MKLKYDSKKCVQKCYIVYDLEFIGDILDLTTCKIWEIAARQLHTTNTFHEICYPYLPTQTSTAYPPPVTPSHVNLSKKWLKQNNASHKAKALRHFMYWMNTFPHSMVVLVSHNNHKTDKFILEHECKQLKIQIPSRVMFLDTLPLFRWKLPTLGSWSLLSIYEHCCQMNHKQTHRALDDVDMLCACLTILLGEQIVYIPGILYSTGHLPLTIVDGIGYATERRLIFYYNIKNVQQLSAFLKGIPSYLGHSYFGTHFPRILKSCNDVQPVVLTNLSD